MSDDEVVMKAKQANEYLAKRKTETAAKPKPATKEVKQNLQANKVVDTLTSPGGSLGERFEQTRFGQWAEGQRQEELKRQYEGRPSVAKEWVQEHVLDPVAETALKRISQTSYDRYKAGREPPTVMEVDEQGNERDAGGERSMQQAQEQLNSVRRARKAAEDPSTKQWTREQWLKWTQENL